MGCSAVYRRPAVYAQLRRTGALLLLGIIASGCSQPLAVKTSAVAPIVAEPPRPREIQVAPVNITVVTSENFNQLQLQIKQDPNTVLLTMAPSDYENLTNNIGDLRRYLQQQAALIDYYENIVKPSTQSKPTTAEKESSP